MSGEISVYIFFQLFKKTIDFFFIYSGIKCFKKMSFLLPSIIIIGKNILFIFILIYLNIYGCSYLPNATITVQRVAGNFKIG